jgi:alanine dehydrogenase
LEERFHGELTTLYSTRENIEQQLAGADLVIGAVLLPGAAAPKLVTREMLGLMKPGTVLVDVAIDQGGCFESSHPTTHADPLFEVEGIIHYCVANMPGAVARTATLALTNATLPYIEALARHGWRRALQEIPGFIHGLNIHSGRVTCAGVADAFDLPFSAPQRELGGG